MMMARVKSARVSMKTRPRIIEARMAPAAPGLRAMPSQAEDATLPCPNAAPNAAMAIPKPAAIAMAPLPPAAAPPSWANAAGAISDTRVRTVNKRTAFFITASLECRQWVVPGFAPCNRSHAERQEQVRWQGRSEDRPLQLLRRGKL